jgi:hypothetical protein
MKGGGGGSFSGDDTLDNIGNKRVKLPSKPYTESV